MKSFLLLIVLNIALAHPSGRISNNEHKLKGDIFSPKLSFVANVDGKSFFVDHSVRRTWASASGYCAGLQMRLATITSMNQFNALKYSTTPEFAHMAYWTAGRDAQEIRQFSWDLTGAPLLASAMTFRKYPLETFPYTNCVWFFRTLTNDSYVSFAPCSNLNYVLCET